MSPKFTGEYMKTDFRLTPIYSVLINFNITNRKSRGKKGI